MQPISEAFETPEYFAFKEYVSKASVDNSLKVKNNHVVYGKSVKEVPPFKSVEQVSEILQEKKLKLLLQLNDVYDAIVVSSTPETYKTQYDALINAIQVIDSKFDEIGAFIQHQNEVMVYEPIQTLEHQLENNQLTSNTIIRDVSQDVHLDKSKIKSLWSAHKSRNTLYQKLAEAKSVVEMDYIVWPDEKPKEDKKSSNKSAALLSSIGLDGTRKSRVSGAKRQSIKNNVKQIMKEKL
jgi:hypothetical protein